MTTGRNRYPDGSSNENPGERPTLPSPSRKPVVPTGCTDLANAERFVQDITGEVRGPLARYVTAWKRWYIWDGKRWAADEIGDIFYYAKRAVRNIYSEAAAAESDERRKALTKKLSKCSQFDPDEVELVQDDCTALVLRPGELLFLPRGTLHSARAVGDAFSVHVTVGIRQPLPGADSDRRRLQTCSVSDAGNSQTQSGCSCESATPG